MMMPNGSVIFCEGLAQPQTSTCFEPFLESATVTTDLIETVPCASQHGHRFGGPHRGNEILQGEKRTAIVG